MALRLYIDTFWVSPYSFSAYVALQEKQLPFDITELALQDGEQKRHDFPQRSFTGRIPALDHDGFWLAESSAIVEYLDETFAPPTYPRLMPAGARERARARMVMAFVRSDLLALRTERPTTTMFYQHEPQPLSAAGRAAAERLVRFAELLIPAGQTQLFDAWSIADADLAFMLQRLAMNHYDLPAPVLAFVQAQWARPSVQAFAAKVRPPYKPY